MTPHQRERNYGENERGEEPQGSHHYGDCSENYETEAGRRSHQPFEHFHNESNSRYVTDVCMDRYPLRKGYNFQRSHQDRVPEPPKTMSYPQDRTPLRNGYPNPTDSGYFLKGSPYTFLQNEHVKQEDGDGYPLPDFDEPPTSQRNVKMKSEPNWTDSDQDIESENETHLHSTTVESRRDMSTPLDSSQQVGEVLSQLVEHQKVLQDKNLKIMEKLINKSTNSFVLDDIPVFDGVKGSIDFETWLLKLDKAVEITSMNVSKLAFSKSSGTPHKMIKHLRREKLWEYIKEKLQITYSKLATDVHASTDLNQNKQKHHEPLEDFIERFYQNYK